MNFKSILFCAAASLMAGSAFGQSFVSTGGEKHVLLEEGTGTWCGYCPDGAQRIQQVIEPTYPKCVIASFHNGDPMQLAGDPFNSAFITGFPGGTVDRVPYSGSMNINRGAWSSAVGMQESVTPNFDVNMVCTYDTSTRLLTMNITGKAAAAVTGNYRINAYVIEDSVSSAASSYQQHSYMNTSSGSWFMGEGSILSASIYSHMSVVRKVMAASGSIWGDTAFSGSTAIGDSVTKTYTYTIPTAYNPKFCKVVGIVQSYGTTTSTRPIDNVAEADVATMLSEIPTSLPTVTKMTNVELFPNPASNYINVRGRLSASSAVTITITNAVGQVVATENYAAGSTMFSNNISLSNMSNGIYFMNISNEEINITKKFVVNK